MATRDLFNARTQQTEPAEFTVDDNNEIVATFEDGGFIKFAAGLSKDEFEQAIELHEQHNTGQVVITPEMEAAKAAERAASFDLIGEKPPTPEPAAPEEPSAGTKIDVKDEASNDIQEEAPTDSAS